MHDEAYYQRRIPRRNLGNWNNFLRFIWDNDTRAFLNRTFKEWGQLGLFYLCFYGALFSIFILQLWISFKNIGFDRPYIQHSYEKSIESRIIYYQPLNRDLHTQNPGLGFIPNIHISVAPIIWINKNNKKSQAQGYIRAIDNFLNSYRNKIYKNSSLYFDIKLLGKCSVSPYGYFEHKPCVYLKLNKRFEWSPVYYNKTSELPEYMPTTLKTLVRSTSQPYIWISCTGATNFDNQHMGIIDYLPLAGLPVNYFPFTGHPNYLSPVVALIFNNLTANRLITIKCNMWAYNIDQSSPLYFQIFNEDDDDDDNK
ncbi:sodium/potassium-transporting ATPase subunit beta-2-like isoform X2 [Microplitis mediator]|uniref:sodium/potassium-transporting ATPase subunit beta-2-like isoform X2 n=1 Tax=Microplitis mediator TaxID=375433 RepID=UPI0025529B3B|nr:sodium/potassium-transporting ATPase subunit beta-2-like isoform X2 [Microplitis mediator]